VDNGRRWFESRLKIAANSRRDDADNTSEIISPNVIVVGGAEIASSAVKV